MMDEMSSVKAGCQRGYEQIDRGASVCTSWRWILTIPSILREKDTVA